MNDLNENINKLLIGCLYADTLINHFMYADDICIFSLSVAVLRKLTDCSTKYGELFNITYNINKYYCNPRKSQEMTSIHCVNVNNRPLPYAIKCKYLGHIINYNLTVDDDIARPKMPLCTKYCLSSICFLFNPSTEITIL